MRSTIQAAELPLSQPTKGAAWAYRFGPDGSAKKLPDDPSLIAPEPNTFAWIHLDLADVRARRWLGTCSFVSAVARSVLLSPDEETQLIAEGDQLCGALPDHTRYLDAGSGEKAHLYFATCDGFLITARRRPLRAPADTRAAIEAGSAAHHPLHLLGRIIDAIVKGLADEAARLAHELESIEDRVLDESVSDERRHLWPLRRTAVHLHRQAGQLRDPFLHIFQKTSGPLAEPIVALKSNALQEIESLHRDLHAIQERARLLQDEVGAKLSAETNRHLYVLTVLTSVLMPATLVTGIFGMNTKGLLFGDDDRGFIYALLICVVGSGLVYLLMSFMGVGRRRGRKTSAKSP